MSVSHTVAETWLAAHADELLAVRRDLHAHPELAHEEHRTTGLLVERLSAAGLSPKVLSRGTGLVNAASTSRMIRSRRSRRALPTRHSC